LVNLIFIEKPIPSFHVPRYPSTTPFPGKWFYFSKSRTRNCSLTAGDKTSPAWQQDAISPPTSFSSSPDVEAIIALRREYTTVSFRVNQMVVGECRLWWDVKPECLPGSVARKTSEGFRRLGHGDRLEHRVLSALQALTGEGGPFSRQTLSSSFFNGFRPPPGKEKGRRKKFRRPIWLVARRQTVA